MWDKKKTFFSGTDQDFEFGYTLLSMENILCRTFWFDRPLLWSARHCPAPSLLRDGCKEQNTPYCFKNPNLDYTILKMKVSRMVT